MIFRLDRLLLSDELVDKFLKALSYVCVPAAILNYYVERMSRCQHLEEIKNLHSLVMKDILNGKCTSKDVNSMQGNMYKKVDKFKRDYVKIVGKYFCLITE